MTRDQGPDSTCGRSLSDCLKNLVEGLDVISCIYTLILVERYLLHDLDIREVVIIFIQCNAMEVGEVEDWDKLVNSNLGLA